jgi:hypothetical protein
MVTRLAVLSLALLLSACQASRPNADFDAGRDFAGYRTWAFKDPAVQYRPDDPRVRSDLTDQRIRQAADRHPVARLGRLLGRWLGRAAVQRIAYRGLQGRHPADRPA